MFFQKWDLDVQFIHLVSHLQRNYYIVDILIKSPVRVFCNHFYLSLSGLGAAVGIIKVGHKKLFLLVSNVTNTSVNYKSVCC